MNAQKIIIPNKPKFGDLGQYNFPKDLGPELNPGGSITTENWQLASVDDPPQLVLQDGLVIWSPAVQDNPDAYAQLRLNQNLELGAVYQISLNVVSNDGTLFDETKNPNRTVSGRININQSGAGDPALNYYPRVVPPGGVGLFTIDFIPLNQSELRIYNPQYNNNIVVDFISIRKYETAPTNTFITTINKPRFRSSHMNSGEGGALEEAMEGRPIRVNNAEINQLMVEYAELFGKSSIGTQLISIETRTKSAGTDIVRWDTFDDEWMYNPSIQNNEEYIEKMKIVFSDDLSNYNEMEEFLSNAYAYENSNSLPENWDKFQNKDLFTKSVGDTTNEKIIEANLKFQGDTFIKIDNLEIKNTGVGGTTKNNRVRVFIFSQEAYGSDPTTDSYNSIDDKLNNSIEIYDETFGNKSEGKDLGNMSDIEGIPIISNFGVESDAPLVEFFEGDKEFDYEEAFQLSSSPDPDLQTSIFNQNASNPIYIIVWMRGDKKVGWPVNTDKRKRKYSIFRINNDELFDKVGNSYQGKSTVFDFTSTTKTKTGGGGGGGAEKAAWYVSSLKVSINTAAGVQNQFSEAANYQDVIPLVQSKTPINENTLETFDWLRILNPANQLDNLQAANNQGSNIAADRHLDFFPLTTFGYSVNNDDGDINFGNNFVDLQSYYKDFNSIMKASSPLNVTFKFDIVDVEGNELPQYGTSGETEYYYFVIDWNDKDNKFKTVNDYFESRPIDRFRYLEKQSQNLYFITKVGTNKTLSNVYTTPGIKNVKIIMFSVFKGNGAIASPSFEVGRWKLITSRFYLDIPPNQYPDFSDVGGSNYTTLPWPYTTAIIGGVDNNSKYKISVNNTLSGGKIGELDIIDEKLLVNDLDNDEMGKSILSFDLEQCRYFDKPYDMNQLLKITNIQPFNSSEYYIENLDKFPFYFEEFDAVQDGIIDSLDIVYWTNVDRPDIAEYIGDLVGDGSWLNLPRYSNFNNYNDNTYWNGLTPETTFSEESSVGQIFISDNQDKDLKQSCKLELNTGNLTGKSISDTSGNSNKGLLIGDYKVKKARKGEPMRRDSFIKVPKKTGNKKGAL